MPLFLLPILETLKQLPWKWILLALSVVALLVGTYQKGKSVQHKKDEARYEKLQESAKQTALQLQAQRLLTKSQAEQLDVKQTTETIIKYVPIEKKVTVYVKTPAAQLPCLDDDGFMLATEAINTANSSLTKPTR